MATDVCEFITEQNEFMGLIDGEFADENTTIKTLIGEFKP